MTNDTMVLKDLRRFELLSELNDAQMEKIAALTRRIEFKFRDRIFEENDAARDLYFLESGRVGIQIELGSGRYMVVENISPGECFGWGALVEPYRYTASAVCVEDTVLLATDGRAMRELMESDPHLGFVMMSGVAHIAALRLKDTRLQLISVAYG
jgi:CRP-like cAMP-binding protein